MATKTLRQTMVEAAICSGFGLPHASTTEAILHLLLAKLGYFLGEQRDGGLGLEEDPDAAAEWFAAAVKRAASANADAAGPSDEGRAAKRSRTDKEPAAKAAGAHENTDASGSDPEADSGSEQGGDEVDFEPEIVEDDRRDVKALQPDALGAPQQLLQFLLAPADLQPFLDAVWQQRPLLVSRPHSPAYFSPWFSRSDVDALLKTGELQHTLNVDVTRYADGKRTTLPAKDGTTEGAADAAYVWRHFDAGCSVRMLHPQRWCDALWKVLGSLELFFRAPVGCNAYLTPPGRQGFAPHSDDIDAFILQLEGAKRWRIYAPRSEGEVLRRDCSPDYSQEDIGEPVLEVELQPGDLLYMPRGAIHQAEALPQEHSLHVTVSVNQRRTWADFLAAALPAALEQAAAENVALRTATPPDLVDFMGVAFSDRQPDRRAAFAAQARAMAEAALEHLPLDEVADHMAADFMHDRLPPVLGTSPGGLAVNGGSGKGGSGGSTAKGKKGGHKRSRAGKSPQPQLRLAAPYAARLVVEEGADGEPAAVVHHAMANSRLAHAEFPPGVANGVSASSGGDCSLDNCESCEDASHALPGRLEFPLEAAEVLEAILHPASATDGSAAPGAIDLTAVPAATAEAAAAAGAGMDDVIAQLQQAGVLVPA